VSARVGELVRGEEYRKLAPYTSVRWTGDLLEVEVDGLFYRLHAIDGLVVERIVEFAKNRYGRIWKKRVSEDLVQVMTEMDQPPGDMVSLELEDIGSGAKIVQNDVAMTRDNRQKVWLANQRAGI
jgi:hypothetical protein